MLKTTIQIKNIVTLVIAIVLITSCGNRAVFKEYRKLDAMSWNRFDIQNFDVSVQKDEQYDFYFFMRHHTNFPYDYLDVNVTFYMPGGEMRSGEYHFKLKDDNGKWIANGMGELWDVELLIRKNLKMKKEGVCKVRIENKMTKMETPGIMEIGLVVKKASE